MTNVLPMESGGTQDDRAPMARMTMGTVMRALDSHGGVISAAGLAVERREGGHVEAVRRHRPGRRFRRSSRSRASDLPKVWALKAASMILSFDQ